MERYLTHWYLRSVDIHNSSFHMVRVLSYN